MAWTQAARDAAKMARQMHAGRGSSQSKINKVFGAKIDRLVKKHEARGAQINPDYPRLLPKAAQALHKAARKEMNVVYKQWGGVNAAKRKLKKSKK